eukprot:CAMPEP_0197595124 /NCGR_PEP_ID=MMETSP1326-20131121/22108_1 /TAXON_ID=1155430 /ORGANISM="Genus nov. species nov., Strain RCC2288" /LENGTH=117 /DNA_ID=CAMNT_0043161421 /DNA_START=310 /DNA_END=660 /DNA_ORIENTATION=-
MTAQAAANRRSSLRPEEGRHDLEAASGLEGGASDAAFGGGVEGSSGHTQQQQQPHHYLGVSQMPSGRYRARIKDRSLGTFDTAEDAAAAYDEAAILLPGGASSASTKVKLNFPGGRG